MLVSCDWLKKYVSLPAGVTLEDAALKLTMSTVEIEAIKNQGKNLENIVVGMIKKVEKHPNADKLKVCQVDIGEGIVKVVCGGSNVSERMLVALAKIGAKVRWRGEGNLVELKETEIRGVKSEGMICASTEIGLSEMFPLKGEKEILDISDAIRAQNLPLTGSGTGLQKRNLDSNLYVNDKLVGKPLSDVLNLSDVIFEIDNKSLTNRPDLWSHYGLARELSAIYKKKLLPYGAAAIKSGKELKLKVEVEDVKLCSRYMAVAMNGVKVSESPDWLKEKLLAVGLRPNNNIVDITNYVMYDLGQPMHAFDASALYGEAEKKIIVRRAKDGEEILGLDGSVHKLDNSILVIADVEKPLALAGIMGGEKSAVRENTTAIIFESANFDAVAVRKATMKLAVRTDSSDRFEKSLDPNLCGLAIRRAVELLLELCPGAKIASNLVDEKHFHLNREPIETTFTFLNKKIGSVLEKKIIVDILSGLGFEVSHKKDNLLVKIPTWRATKDISIPEDLVEEVIRIFGYDNIAASLPIFPIITPEENKLRKLENLNRDILINGFGYFEAYNYSFVSAKQIENIGDDVKKYVELDNPLSKDKPYLRRNLLLNLLENVVKNIEFAEAIKIFEIGKVFLMEEPGQRIGVKSDELLPRQDIYLTAVAAEKKDKNPFWQSRRALETVFGKFGYIFQVEDKIKLKSWEHQTRSGKIIVGGAEIGWVYELNPLIGERVGLESRLGVLEINLSKLAEARQKKIVYKSLPVYPEAGRDIAVLVKKNVSNKELSAVFVKTSPLVKKVELFDAYSGESLGDGYKSLAYHITYAARDRTLKSEEIDAARQKMVAAVKKLGGEVR